MAWYSASIRRAVMVGEDGIGSLWDSVVLISATTRDEAWEKATKRGKEFETAYLNGVKERVRLAFLGVLTIDELGTELRTGQEVYFSVEEFANPIPVSLDVAFFPERMKSGNSGVGVEQPSVGGADPPARRSSH